MLNEFSNQNRESIIIRTSIIGILSNIFLSVFKVIIGISSNSIAIILDGVNNVSDALSSIITIIAASLSNRLPDKKHPLGHGRIEYLGDMIVACIVLYAGITSAVESFKKIISPEKANYGATSLIIMSVAIIVKFILGKYTKSQGKRINAKSLIASGSDAIFDAVLSFSVFISAVIYLICDISLEAFVGLIISTVIIKSGIEMMVDTINAILGESENPQLISAIKNILTDDENVKGAYDLILHDYGPNKHYASVHLELADTMTVKEVDSLSRKLESKVFKKTGVIITGIGVYSYNTENDESAKIENDIRSKVMSNDFALQFHGFYLDKENMQIRYDVVISFDIEPAEALDILYKQITQSYPEYKFTIITDIDVSLSN